MATSKPVKRIKLDSKKSGPNKKKVVEEATIVAGKKKTIPSSTQKKRISAPRGAQIIASPFTGFWRYTKGSWNELRQVRWPNRSATWGLTLAVIAFTLFFTAIILILDAGFQYLFKEVLLK